MKKKLLVSFSGGETSGYMAYWLKKHKSDEYDMIFVFANTGQENEETLEFANMCDREFGLNLIWVEANVHHGERKGTTHKIVDFYTASRNGEPFEEHIKKYGIPNQTTPHCTRELKERPINSYCRSIGWKDFYLAIGIRADEVDRVSSKHKQKKIIYPLVSDIPMTKQKVNFWWSQQIFRLGAGGFGSYKLKGYEGNCKTCWKKSEKKLIKIAQDNPERFDFFKLMENRYENFIPETRQKRMAERGITPKFPTRFFRGNKSVEDIIRLSNTTPIVVIDDSDEYDDDKSCEVFSQCGIDN